MRILFVTSNRVGDAVLSTGLLDHLIRRYPESRITVACGPVAEGVFSRMPNLERLLLFEKQPRGRHWLGLWAATVGTFWNLVVDIRASAISYVVPTLRRAVMRKLPGTKVEQLGLILGLAPPPMPVVWTAPEDRARMAQLLPPGPPIVGLAPTANWDGKVWPPERFVAFYRALTAGPLAGARAAVFAGPGAQERALADPVVAALPEAIDLTGQLTLPEVAAGIARCALLVANDSGLMHLAAATGAPTLGLYGPTQAKAIEFAPAGPRTGMVIARGPAMTDLPVADALEAARALITPLVTA